MPLRLSFTQRGSRLSRQQAFLSILGSLWLCEIVDMKIGIVRLSLELALLWRNPTHHHHQFITHSRSLWPDAPLSLSICSPYLSSSSSVLLLLFVLKLVWWFPCLSSRTRLRDAGKQKTSLCFRSETLACARAENEQNVRTQLNVVHVCVQKPRFVAAAVAMSLIQIIE